MQITKNTIIELLLAVFLYSWVNQGYKVVNLIAQKIFPNLTPYLKDPYVLVVYAFSVVLIASITLTIVYVKKLEKILIISLFLLSVFLLMGGIDIIDVTLGPPTIDGWKIKDVTMNGQIGTITCKDVSGRLVSGNLISCTISTNFSITSSNLTQYFFRGGSFSRELKDDSFIANANVDSVRFDFMYNDSQTIKKAISTNNIRFPTVEEAIARRDKIPQAYFGLISLIVSSMLIYHQLWTLSRKKKLKVIYLRKNKKK